MQFARTRTSGQGTALLIAVIASAVVLAAPTEARSMRAADLEKRVVTTGSSGYGFKSAEICFMRKINGVRQRHGLRALRWDKQLGYVARRHARQLASNNAVYHDENMGNEITRWRKLGQNTGAGRNCRSLFRSFMRSPSHRANVLGTWRYMAVGTEYRGSKLFTQHIFENFDNPGNIYHWP